MAAMIRGLSGSSTSGTCITEKMKEKTAKLTADNVVAPIGSFTAKEYKQVLSVLHSDREASKERKTNAFKVFKKAFGSGR